MTEAVPDAVDDAMNVLVVAPEPDPATTALHLDLLTATPPPETSVVAVACTETAGRWVQTWQRRVGDLPARLGVVAAAGSMRSAADGVDPTGGGPVERRVVDHPGDLTGLGIAVTDFLKQWGDLDAPMAVCLDSVTALLRHRELHAVYRFLHVLTNRFRAVDAAAHYHLDPQAVEDGTTNRLTPLFDAVVSRSGDGEDWTVRRR